MKTSLKILSFAAILLMSAVAGKFVFNLGVDMYGISTVGSAVVAIVIAVVIFGSQYIPDIWPQAALFFALTAKTVGRNPNPKNIAGIEGSHYWCYAEDILTWPDGLTPDFIASTTFGQLVTIPTEDVFVFKTGKCFYETPCTLETGSVKSTMVGPTESKAFENTVSYENAGNNPELDGMIANTANKQTVHLVKELNGTVKVVGTQEYPALLDTAEKSNGPKVSDGNMAKHSFKSCSTIPCPTYLGAVPLTPAA